MKPKKITAWAVVTERGEILHIAFTKTELRQIHTFFVGDEIIKVTIQPVK